MYKLLSTRRPTLKTPIPPETILNKMLRKTVSYLFSASDSDAKNIHEEKETWPPGGGSKGRHKKE